MFGRTKKRVVCINADNSPLVQGKEYTVSKVINVKGGDTYYHLEGIPSEINGFYPTRFRVLPPDYKAKLDAKPIEELMSDKPKLAGQPVPVGTNPKDLLGVTKVSITKLPAVAILHGAHAMMDGVRKYGAYNWRDKPVIASIYVDALLRHTLAFFQGQEIAPDSKVKHLGHAIACAAILLDAQATGNLVDDRPIFGNPDLVANELDALSEVIKQKGK